MKLLYIGSHVCPYESLGRLLLLGSEICFLDRPSVTFDNWGTIGHDSFMRRFSFAESPVTVSVMKPPGGPADALYEPYVLADLTSPQFLEAVHIGLRTDDVFAERLLQPTANHGDGRNGGDIRRLLIADESLPTATFDLSRGATDLMYKPDTAEGRRAIFRTLVADVSVQITAAQLLADEIDALPIGDDATYPKLLALRASLPRYVGGAPAMAPFLGLQFARAVIPDAALHQINFQGIFEYRRKTKGLYDAWSIELAKASAKIGEAELTHPAETIQKIIASELMPKVREYENEMESARDQLFGNLIKGLATWEIPAISLSYVADLGYAGALAMFVAGARATIPHAVDFVNARKAAKRKHAVSYLVGLTRQFKEK